MEKKMSSLRDEKRQLLLALMTMVFVFAAVLFAAPVRAQAAKKLVVKDCGATIYQSSYDKNRYEVAAVAGVYNPNPGTTVIFPHGNFYVYSKSGKLIKQSYTNGSHVAPGDTIYMFSSFTVKKSEGVPYKVRFKLDNDSSNDYVTPNSKLDWRTSGFKVKNLRLMQRYSSYYYTGKVTTKYKVSSSVAVVVVFRKNGKLAGQIFTYAKPNGENFEIYLPKEMKEKLAGARAAAYVYPRNFAAQR